MSCFVIGDSLAVGVGQFRPDCETIAKVGITSEKYMLTRFPAEGIAADVVVVSLGVNDGDTSATLDNLEQLRSRLRTRAVYWLLPGLKEEVRRAIRDVAAEYGDRLIDTLPEVGADHLHPSGAGYRRLAARIEGGESDDEEVAFAPAEPQARNSNRRTYAVRHRFAAHRLAYATPRERIARLKVLRAADASAPVLRRRLADIPYRQEPVQRTMHVTFGREAMARRPTHAATVPLSPAPRALRCPSHMRSCQLSVR